MSDTNPDTPVFNETVAEQAAQRPTSSVEQLAPLGEQLEEAKDDAEPAVVESEPQELRVVTEPVPEHAETKQVLVSAGPVAPAYDPFDRQVVSDPTVPDEDQRTDTEREAVNNPANNSVDEAVAAEPPEPEQKPQAADGQDVFVSADQSTELPKEDDS